MGRCFEIALIHSPLGSNQSTRSGNVSADSGFHNCVAVAALFRERPLGRRARRLAGQCWRRFLRSAGAVWAIVGALMCSAAARTCTALVPSKPSTTGVAESQTNLLRAMTDSLGDAGRQQYANGGREVALASGN